MHASVCLYMDLEQEQKFAEPYVIHPELKAPSDIPGGRINTMSWRLVCCYFLGTNGHDETRMWPLCCVCPMRRVAYRTIWPRLLLDWWIRKVSNRARFCLAYFVEICRICKIKLINIQNMLICKKCKKCVHLHGFAYRIYFTYEIYISHSILRLCSYALSSIGGQAHAHCMHTMHAMHTFQNWPDHRK